MHPQPEDVIGVEDQDFLEFGRRELEFTGLANRPGEHGPGVKVVGIDFPVLAFRLEFGGPVALTGFDVHSPSASSRSSGEPAVSG